MLFPYLTSLQEFHTSPLPETCENTKSQIFELRPSRSHSLIYYTVGKEQETEGKERETGGKRNEEEMPQSANEVNEMWGVNSIDLRRLQLDEGEIEANERLEPRISQRVRAEPLAK